MQASKTQTLYDQWKRVVAARPIRPAVRRLATGEVWTFAELDTMAETAATVGAVLSTQETGLALVVDVLRAWRDGSVLLAEETGRMVVPEVGALAEGVCHLKVTSGSGGERRCVMFRAEQLAADARQIVATMGLKEMQSNLGVISMSHSYGFSNLVLPLLLHGVPLWLGENPLPETLRQALAQTADVTLPAVPAMWRAWHHAGVDLSKVRLAISAGAPLPLDLETAVYERSGVKLHNFYGSSECGGIAYDRSQVPRPDATLAGTALEGVALSVQDGCLRVQSAATGVGYVGAAEPWEPGNYQTQDHARVAETGDVQLLGRAGEVISVAGYKVPPEMVEAAVAQISGVRCCVVFGVPSRDVVRGEEVVACVSLHPATEHTAQSLRRALPSLPSSAVPKHWWVCSELVPDARGKLSRPVWRQRWLAEADPR